MKTMAKSAPAPKRLPSRGEATRIKAQITALERTAAELKRRAGVGSGVSGHATPSQLHRAYGLQKEAEECQERIFWLRMKLAGRSPISKYAHL